MEYTIKGGRLHWAYAESFACALNNRVSTWSMFDAKTIHPITILWNLFRKKCMIIRAMFASFLPAYDVSSRVTSFWADPSRPSCHLYIRDRQIRSVAFCTLAFRPSQIPKQKRKRKQQNCRSISGPGTNQNRTTSSATLTQSRRHDKRAKRGGSLGLGSGRTEAKQHLRRRRWRRRWRRSEAQAAARCAAPAAARLPAPSGTERRGTLPPPRSAPASPPGIRCARVVCACACACARACLQCRPLLTWRIGAMMVLLGMVWWRVVLMRVRVLWAAGCRRLRKCGGGCGSWRSWSSRYHVHPPHRMVIWSPAQPSPFALLAACFLSASQRWIEMWRQEVGWILEYSILI